MNWSFVRIPVLALSSRRFERNSPPESGGELSSDGENMARRGKRFRPGLQQASNLQNRFPSLRICPTGLEIGQQTTRSLDVEYRQHCKAGVRDFVAQFLGKMKVCGCEEIRNASPKHTGLYGIADDSKDLGLVKLVQTYQQIQQGRESRYRCNEYPSAR